MINLFSPVLHGAALCSLALTVSLVCLLMEVIMEALHHNSLGNGGALSKTTQWVSRAIIWLSFSRGELLQVYPFEEHLLMTFLVEISFLPPCQ